MSEPNTNRRTVLKAIGATLALAQVPQPGFSEPVPKAAPFTYCLNMSTIRGHKLGFVKELETASKAGFRSIEIWMDSLQAHAKSRET